MKLTKQNSLRALCAAAILTLSASAQATPLNRAFAGEAFLDTGLGGTTSFARPELAGTVASRDDATGGDSQGREHNSSLDGRRTFEYRHV